MEENIHIKFMYINKEIKKRTKQNKTKQAKHPNIDACHEPRNKTVSCI